MVYKPVEVKVPVPVPCVEKAPEKPSLITDSELRKLGEGDFVLALGADRVQRRQYEDELEAVLTPCLAKPTKSPKP